MALEVIEREGKRVLMTAQIADAFEADTKTINRNFQRNQGRFQQGTHFFALTGEALKQFKGERQNDATLKFASNLYLWTEQGAFMLAKSLNSDKAWQAYNLLINQYFKMTKEISATTEHLALPYLEKRLITLENRIEEMSQNMTLHTGEQKRVQRAVAERIYEVCKEQAERPKLFRELYGSLKLRYTVESYRDIKQQELQDALRFISTWKGAL